MKRTFKIFNFYFSAHELILAKFDDKFFRAMCMQVLENGKFAVQYIDYGNIADISSAHIMQLPHKFLHHPTIAHVCYVEGIFQLFLKFHSLVFEQKC